MKWDVSGQADTGWYSQKCISKPPPSATRPQLHQRGYAWHERQPQAADSDYAEDILEAPERRAHSSRTADIRYRAFGRMFPSSVVSVARGPLGNRHGRARCEPYLSGEFPPRGCLMRFRNRVKLIR